MTAVGAPAGPRDDGIEYRSQIRYTLVSLNKIIYMYVYTHKLYTLWQATRNGDANKKKQSIVQCEFDPTCQIVRRVLIQNHPRNIHTFNTLSVIQRGLGLINVTHILKVTLLRKSYDWSSASDATMNDIAKWIAWIIRNWGHDETKQSTILCRVYWIHCRNDAFYIPYNHLRYVLPRA